MSIGTELKRKLWLSLAYPILSILVAIALLVFVNVVLVSQFETIFRDFGIPLPGLTISMIMVSHVLRAGLAGPADLGRGGRGALAGSAALCSSRPTAAAWPPRFP